MSDVPTLYHRYKGHVYQIKVMPHGVEVKRYSLGTSPFAKSIPFETATGVRNGNEWNTAAVERLIDRYEGQVAAEPGRHTMKCFDAEITLKQGFTRANANGHSRIFKAGDKVKIQFVDYPGEAPRPGSTAAREGWRFSTDLDSFKAYIFNADDISVLRLGISDYMNLPEQFHGHNERNIPFQLHIWPVD